MPLSPKAFSSQTSRLLGHYRPGEPTDRFADWLDEVSAAFVDSSIVNDATFTAAVTNCIKQRTSHSLPLVSDLLQYAEATWAAYRRWEGEEERQALPPPKRSETGPDPSAYVRNLAIGKARQRKRIALINAYRSSLPPGVWKYGGEQSHHWRGKDTPTEEEIDAVLYEMRANGLIDTGPLADALSVRVPTDVLNVPWVESPIAMGVPGEVEEVPTDTPRGPTITVRWADGKETRTQVLDEDHARLANRWLRKHNPGQEN